MSLSDLVAEAELPRDIADAVDALVGLKAATREMGTGPVPDALRAFITRTFDDTDIAAIRSREDVASARERASAFFIDAVRKYGPQN